MIGAMYMNLRKKLLVIGHWEKIKWQTIMKKSQQQVDSSFKVNHAK
jgi:hypothetical protein